LKVDSTKALTLSSVVFRFFIFVVSLHFKDGHKILGSYKTVLRYYSRSIEAGKKDSIPGEDAMDCDYVIYFLSMLPNSLVWNHVIG